MVVEIYGDARDIEICDSYMAKGAIDIKIENITLILTREQAEMLYERLDEQLYDTTAKELQDKYDDIEFKYERLKEEYEQLQELYVELQQDARRIA